MADPDTKTCSLCERILPVFDTEVEVCLECLLRAREFRHQLELQAGTPLDDVA